MTLIEILRARTNLLSTKELMALLDRTRNTICAWARAGRIPAIRIGSGYRYDPIAIADWLEARNIVVGKRKA